MKLLLSSLFLAGGLALLVLDRQSVESDEDIGGLRLVVTQVPAGSAGEASLALPGVPFSRRYPSGSRVVLVETGSGELVRVLSEGLDAAGAPALSPHGDRVVFAGRRRPDSRWCIYETRLRRGRPDQRIEIAGDCGDPAYLPKDGIVFIASPNGAADESRGAEVSSYLCSVSGRASGVRRITFGPGAAMHPSVLRDGRLLFSMAADPLASESAASRFALFTVNPDGTMLDPFSGVHDESRSALRARQSEDGRIVFLSVPTESSEPAIASVELARPMGGRTDLTLLVGDAGTEGSALPLVVGSAEPLAEAGLLLTGRPPSPSNAKTFGVYLLADGAVRAERVFDDPEWNEVEAVPVEPRQPPRARPSSVAVDQRRGALICYDAGYSDGVYGPERGAAAPVFVSLETFSRAAAEAGIAAESAVETEAGIVGLGTVALASDRSFFVRVPADLPLRVRSFDSEREPIATSGWFWIRPGETRACFGCHERRDTAPPNRIVEAIAEQPQELGMTERDISK